MDIRKIKVVKKNLGILKKEGAEKILDMSKKWSSKKFGEKGPKNREFRHIPEINRLKQPFLGLKSLKNEFLGL